MRVSYANHKLREICESPFQAAQTYGLTKAQELHSLFADIQAAACLADVPCARSNPPPKSNRLDEFYLPSGLTVEFLTIAERGDQNPKTPERRIKVTEIRGDHT